MKQQAFVILCVNPVNRQGGMNMYQVQTLKSNFRVYTLKREESFYFAYERIIL